MNFDMNSCWSRAVELIQANFQLLLIVAAVFILLPNITLYMLVPEMQAIADPLADQAVVEAQMAEMMGPLLGGGLFAMVFQFAGYCAMIALMGDKRPTVGQALGQGFKTVPSLFAVAILFILMYFLGAVVIVLPVSLLAGLAGSTMLGVIGFVPVLVFVAWLAARVSMSMPVMVLEDTLNPIKALSRSFALTKPKQWPILGFWMAIIVIMVIASLIFTSVFGLVASLAGTGLVAALIIGLATGAAGVVYGMVLCGVAAAMYAQLAGPSVDAIEDTFG